MRNALYLAGIYIFMIITSLPLHSQSTSPVKEIILPYTDRFEFDLWIDLNTATDHNDIVRVRDAVDVFQAQDFDMDSINLRTKVTIAFNPRTVTPGLFHVDVLGGNPRTIKGSRQVRFRWGKLADPVIHIWPLGRREDARKGKLILPENGVMSYGMRLSHDSDLFLYTDRIRFNDQRIKVSSGNPTGPVPGNPREFAEYVLTVDAEDPPNLGVMALEVANPDRLASTFTQIRIASDAQPILSAVDQKEVTVGRATITVHGDHFDRGAHVLVDGVSVSYTHLRAHET